MDWFNHMDCLEKHYEWHQFCRSFGSQSRCFLSLPPAQHLSTWNFRELTSYQTALWWWHQNKIYLSRITGVSKGKMPAWQDWQYIHMISIYYNKEGNCLDSQLFGNFDENVTQEKYFMTNGKILFTWNGFGRLTGKKLHQIYSISAI